MSKLSELRARASRTKEEYTKIKVEKAKDAITNLANSSAFVINSLNLATGDTEEADKKQLDKFVEDVATTVIESVTNPVTEFEDTCLALGLQQWRIERVVNSVTNLFSLCGEDAPYAEKLEATALYFKEHPYFYDDIVDLA